MTKKEEKWLIDEAQNNIHRKKQAINICMHKMKHADTLEKCKDQQIILNEIYEKLNKL